MVNEDDAAPATKADFKALGNRFDGLEGRFDGLEGRFDGLEGRFDGLEGRFDGLNARVDTMEKRLDQKIDRVAVELVRTQADIRDIRETMATKSDVNRILGAIDAFAMKTEYGERARALHGQTLVDVEVTLKDHEKRLSSLEAPRPPSQP